ncbi:putative siderophore biosynthesis protein [Lasiodiplodia theobromae]|uniref:Siderophore biosynthesis protein n=1 Tax=Lasiodiplodia theobromae TaxID=45133 RepID=UPI0015C3A7F0|nr:Siderophore biosynthesis protein [Lasiodiplodia theobromae]KAF4536829.1 Siderophore biosynthesis protein [Lasiodiplodia theobromae]KAF9635182.1 putative siderophore biosynthesis protein [Lasiodiplodia theobromae]
MTTQGLVHLPNGQNLTAVPVFGGLQFKVNDLSSHSNSPLPPGWTVVLNSQIDEPEDEEPDQEKNEDNDEDAEEPKAKRVRRYTRPTLQNDHLYISSISNPSSTEFKPASSPTRQIAMMLWATLYWYFHQPEPEPQLTTAASKNTAQLGKPRGDWRININREGIFKGRVVLPKLERMGLIASEDSSVGIVQDEKSGEGWTNMFVSRRAFWQMDPRLYLFTLPALSMSPHGSESPFNSRPNSPTPAPEHKKRESASIDGLPSGLWSPTAPGPFHSSSHLPTYYPPGPTQYIFSNNIRHPLRPKPPRQGETFYTRYIPSVGQYLSFRVASASPKPQTHTGPISHRNSVSGGAQPSIETLALGDSDTDLLHRWMNDPRVSHFWGEQGPRAHQEAFLKTGLQSRHSFPVIGCWDGKPFGYFEIYWVKEDGLGKHLGGDVANYDRGLHCLVGEQEFRGAHRVRIWLSALVHYCFLADMRTETVMLEPRVDNEKLRKYLEEVGFYKEREVSFPHKQSNLMKIRREAWNGPAL